ncbi:MAG TPA: M23 family metallopeptidase [Sphingomonas sp.]|jgi:murein DD-endopeptidase MepM/ murein hydrolase activator NlpD
MPTVPVDTQNRVAADPLPRQRLQAADFGAAGEQIGRAVAGFGRAASQAVDDQDRLNERFDTAATKDRLSKVLTDIAPIRNQVLSAKGLDATAARADAQKKLTELRKTYIGSMTTPRQQRMLGEAFDRIQLQEFETYDGHERKQVETANVDASNARYSSSMDRAVTLAGVNDDAAQSSLADALTEVGAANPGAAPETLALKRAETVSGYHVAVAAKLLDEDPVKAKAYVDSHAGEISAADETKLRKGMKDDVDEAVVDAAYGETLAGIHGVEAAPDEAKVVERQGAKAAANADPLRGKGRQSSGFTDTRDGGRRMHAAEDIAAPAGTPVLPPMSGKVLKAWFDKEGGNSVLIQHPNGKVTGYAHLRNVNVSAGDEVDATTVIGGVGNTGSASRGNHLHYTVRNAPGGPKVDPTKVSWKEGDLPAYSAQTRPALENQYAAARRVAQANNLSPRQFQKLLSRVDQDANRNDALKRDSEDRARDAVYSRLDQLGDNFTSITQLPAADRARLAPGVLSTLRNVADGNAKGDAVEAGGGTYLDLYEMSGNPASQQAFVNADLYKVRGSMSKGEWLQLRKHQIDLKNGGGKGEELGIDYSRVSTMVGRYAPQSAGLTVQGKTSAANEARVRRARVEAKVRDQVAVMQQKKGAKLTDDELAGVVRAQLAPVYLGGDTSKPMARGALGANQNYAVSVPKVERDQIIAAYRKAYGNRPLTEGMIARFYLDAGGGLK